MTIHEAVFSPFRLPLMGTLFLLLTGQMMAGIAAFRDGRSLRTRILLLVPFFSGAMILWICMSFISWDIDFPDGSRPLSPWLAAVGSLPVRTVVLTEILLALLLVLSLRNTLRYRKNHLTPDSVKQTMDLLPVGVAFAEPDGAVLFRNVVMDHLSQVLTGKLLTDLAPFRAAAGGGEEQTQLTLENRVWQVDTRQAAVGEKSLLQMTARDITEQAGILADLEARNKKLKDIQLRLEIYQRQAERIIIAQEMLTARMTVHDQLGHILLESRHYLKDSGAFSEARFLQALKNTNTSLLREYEQDDTARDALTDAIELADAIGVEVTVAGRVPAEESLRGVLAAAIQECAANTVKHAGGSMLTVRILPEKDGTGFSLENDGTAPTEPIRESGGLLSLRAFVESRGGTMQVESVPRVRITIFLPESAKTDGISSISH